MQRRWLLGALGLVAVLTALGSVSLAGKGGGGKPPKDPPPAADPAIAFRQGDQLSVMDADGSNKIAVFEGRGITVGQPTWSPDGQQLAFYSDAQGPGVYVINVDGTGLRKVVATNRATSLLKTAWSPLPTADGEHKLAFTDSPLNTDGSLGWYDVFLVNLDGTGLLNLTNTPGLYEFHMTWSPEADRLAALETDSSNADELVIHDLDVVNGSLAITGTISITSEGPLSGADLGFPSWAKIGNQIAVTSYGAPSSELWVIDVTDPTYPVNITNTPDINERFPSFSPDDTEIAFLRLPSNREGIHVMPADGSGAPSRIYKGQSIGPLSWRRNP